MIFQAQDVGQDHDAIAFLDQSHRDAGHRLFESARPHPSSPGFRRRRSPWRTSRWTRGYRRQCAACMETVPYGESRARNARSASAPWPTSRRPGEAKRPGFADTKGREIVMQHKGPGSTHPPTRRSVAHHRSYPKSRRPSFAFPPVEARSHGAWQHADLQGDRPNIRRPTAVGA